MNATTTALSQFFTETRNRTEQICAPLEIEDYVVQPIADVSPPKWHLGHSTWFFEEFILKAHQEDYQVFNANFGFVFNSYYESMGARVVRTDRGNLSRPTVQEVYEYRRYVTNHIEALLEQPISSELESLLTIGIHHEKQHQELLLTDIKYILGNNPLQPAYGTFKQEHLAQEPSDMIAIDEGLYEIGHQGEEFCYDNELGLHQVFLEGFSISNSLVTNGDFLAFINDGGYKNAMLWHSEGWAWVKEHQITAPQYWQQDNGSWQHYTLEGVQPLQPTTPVTHLSYYEAYAFAQWKGMRLPTEFEWEVAQAKFNWGSRWEWTESAYLPYPRYTKAPGALGEYNGKFMVSQKVLRGGSVATPTKHTRHTYRNFFHPSSRWQYTGLRLAK